MLAHLWGPTVALAVVATGNHFVFDIAAGMVAAAAGYGLGLLVQPRRVAAATHRDARRRARHGRARRSRVEHRGDGVDLQAAEDAEVRLEDRSRERREALARRDRRRRLLPWLLCPLLLPALGAAA